MFGTGLRRRALDSLHRVWGGGEAAEPLPLVEIAAIGGLTPAETCHVVLHELAHVLTPGSGRGRAWRYAARQVGLLQPWAWPGMGELAYWGAIAPGLRRKLQAIPEPIERAPAEYYDWHRRPCGEGYGSRRGTSRGAGAGSRYLKVTCQPRLRLPGAAHAQVVGAGGAALSDRRPRQLGIGSRVTPVEGSGPAVCNDFGTTGGADQTGGPETKATAPEWCARSVRNRQRSVSHGREAPKSHVDYRRYLIGAPWAPACKWPRFRRAKSMPERGFEGDK